MRHIPIHPDECHETIVQIETEFIKKLIAIRTEYIRQLAATTNSEELNKVFAHYRALSEESHAVYSYKYSAYNKEHNSKADAAMEQLIFDYIMGTEKE